MVPVAGRGVAAVVVAACIVAGGCGLPRGGLSGDPLDAGADPPADTGAGAGDAPGADGSTGAPDAAAPHDGGTESAATVDAASLDAVADAPPVESGAPPDAAESGPPPVLTVLQSASNSDSPNSVTVSLSSNVSAGSFLAVLVTFYGGSGAVSGVSDDAPGSGDTYTSVGASSSTGSCQTSEIWYARNTVAGASQVVVHATGGVSLDAWVVEVAGLAPTGGVDAHAEGNGAATTTVAAPTVTPTGSPALVVSTAGSCGALNGLAAISSFVGLPIQDGNGAAYFVATAPGSYAPVYDNSNDKWNASTAAFR